MTSSITAQPVVSTEIRAGALTTLAAIGSYNKFTICDPTQISFAGQIFQRHTNFSVAFHTVQVESKPQQAEFWPQGKMVKLRFNQNRNADLIGPSFLHCYWGRLQTNVAAKQIAWVNELGNAVVLRARFTVGNVRVEENTGEALHCLKETGIRGPGLDESQMLGAFSVPTPAPLYSRGVPSAQIVYSSANNHTYTPLNFHFCQQKEEYFPLVAVQYNDPVIEIDLRAKEDLIYAANMSSGVPGSVYTPLAILSEFSAGVFEGGDLYSMDICYSGIYLDAEERRLRAQKPYSYVFKYIRGPQIINVTQYQKQVQQKIEWENATASYFWFYIDTLNVFDRQYFDFSTRAPFASIPSIFSGFGTYTRMNPFAEVTIKVNDNVRVRADGMYFYQVAPYVAQQNRLPTPPSYICSYHYDMDASVWNQDFGSQNDGRIDNLVFDFTFVNSSADFTTGAATNNGIAYPGQIQLYAKKFSVAKVAGGQFGLVFPTV